MTPEVRIGSVRISVDLGEGRFDLASETILLEGFDGKLLDPVDLAGPLADAWQKAVERAERTLTLFGWEGVAARDRGAV